MREAMSPLAGFEEEDIEGKEGGKNPYTNPDTYDVGPPVPKQGSRDLVGLANAKVPARQTMELCLA